LLNLAKEKSEVSVVRVFYFGRIPIPLRSGFPVQDLPGGNQSLSLSRAARWLIERHLRYCGVEITAIAEKEPEDTQSELVRDLLAIVTFFLPVRRTDRSRPGETPGLRSPCREAYSQE